MKKRNNLAVFLICFMVVLSCQKKKVSEHRFSYEGRLSNREGIPITKLDSTQVINKIIGQKIQELYDLSCLYVTKNRDAEIDSVIYNQMKTYFEKPDSLLLAPVIHRMDSLKARHAWVDNLKVSQEIIGKDTVHYAIFNMKFKNKKKENLGSFPHRADYVLKKSPIKFKQEFQFYFLKIYEVKDFRPKGVIR